MMRVLLTLSLVAGLMGGCTSARKSTPNAVEVFKPAREHDVSTYKYRIDPPDEIIIHAPRTELDNQRRTVGPDGKISLTNVGDVYVAGKSPEEVNALLKGLLEKYYTNVDVKVEVVANSKFYVITGPGVMAQGRYAYTGRDTVVNALAEAGLNENGWPQQVWVSRPAKGNHDKATVVVDFKKVFETGDMSQNYLLEEGDIVYVPNSPLAAWNQNMTKTIGPLTGAAAGVSSGQTVVRAGRPQ